MNGDLEAGSVAERLHGPRVVVETEGVGDQWREPVVTPDLGQSVGPIEAVVHGHAAHDRDLVAVDVEGADGDGRVSGSIVLPKLEGGTHTLQLTGPFSGNVAAVKLVVLALAETGRDAAPLAGLAAVVLLAGGALLVAGRRARRGSGRIGAGSTVG